MKIYEKKYENYYTRPELLEKFNKQDISTGDISFEEYTGRVRSVLRESQMVFFDQLVKISWLAEKFKVNGLSKKMDNTEDILTRYIHSIFLRNIVGIDMRFIYNSSYFRKIVTYFHDWFPDFSLSNPFEVKYEFPYEHVGFDELLLVVNMEERLEILGYAEKQKMSLPEFGDFVINYVFCLNEELGFEKYYFRKRTRGSAPHEYNTVMLNKNI